MLKTELRYWKWHHRMVSQIHLKAIWGSTPKRIAQEDNLKFRTPPLMSVKCQEPQVHWWNSASFCSLIISPLVQMNDPAKAAQADFWFFTVLKETSALNLGLPILISSKYLTLPTWNKTRFLVWFINYYIPSIPAHQSFLLAGIMFQRWTASPTVFSMMSKT